VALRCAPECIASVRTRAHGGQLAICEPAPTCLHAPQRAFAPCSDAPTQALLTIELDGFLGDRPVQVRAAGL